MTVRLCKSHLLSTRRDRLSVGGDRGTRPQKGIFQRVSSKPLPLPYFLSRHMDRIRSSWECCENERQHINPFLWFQVHSGGSVNIFLFSPTLKTAVTLHRVESGGAEVACSGESDSLSGLLGTAAVR